MCLMWCLAHNKGPRSSSPWHQNNHHYHCHFLPPSHLRSLQLQVSVTMFVFTFQPQSAVFTTRNEVTRAPLYLIKQRNILPGVSQFWLIQCRLLLPEGWEVLPAEASGMEKPPMRTWPREMWDFHLKPNLHPEPPGDLWARTSASASFCFALNRSWLAVLFDLLTQMRCMFQN